MCTWAGRLIIFPGRVLIQYITNIKVCVPERKTDGREGPTRTVRGNVKAVYIPRSRGIKERERAGTESIAPRVIGVRARVGGGGGGGRRRRRRRRHD